MKENETKTQNNTNDAKSQQSKASKILKTVFNTIINILIVVVLITSILVAVMALTSKANGISAVFGYTIQPIQSDSMLGGSPDGYGGKDFGKGDLMIAKATNYDANAVYDLGDIITYVDHDAYGEEFLMSHRIVDVQKLDDGTSVYQTWGDNREMSAVPDQNDIVDYLRPQQIASVYYTSDYEGLILKGMGAPLDYLRTQQGFFFVILLPMIIFFMYELIRVVLNASSYRKAKADEIKKEAVDTAVAKALAEKNSADSDTAAEMTPEQMEQFKQFLEFQKQQKQTESDSNNNT